MTHPVVKGFELSLQFVEGASLAKPDTCCLEGQNPTTVSGLYLCLVMDSRPISRYCSDLFSNSVHCSEASSVKA